ncbi:MAG: hypothetical protein ABR573_00455 [Candidatus Dormibacteria bacterium]
MAAGNTMRWNGRRRGHYEGWFLAFNNPAAEAGYWVRWSLVAPTDAAREPFAQAWFMRTDSSTQPRNRATRTTFPISALDAASGPFKVTVGPSTLTGGGTSGRLEDEAGEVSWDLRFQSLLPGFTPTPEWGARVATCFQEPHPLVAVSGTITEGRRTQQIDGWLGSQAHVFGARHSERWHWAECKHLAPGSSFTGVAAWPRFPPRTVTSLALFGTSPGVVQTGTLAMFRPVTKHSPEGWKFDAEYGMERLAGSVVPRVEDLIGITYHDPSGQPVRCYHSELADIRLRYYRRASRKSVWRLEHELAAPHAAAFEYGSLSELPGVPLLLD